MKIFWLHFYSKSGKNTFFITTHYRFNVVFGFLFLDLLLIKNNKILTISDLTFYYFLVALNISLFPGGPANFSTVKPTSNILRFTTPLAA